MFPLPHLTIRTTSPHIPQHYITQLLLAVNPNAKSVTSESLSALWVLEWTTEKEILFLMESGLPWKPSGPVQQEIDVDAKTLSNRMIFGDDSLFEVSSSIDPEVCAVFRSCCGRCNGQDSRTRLFAAEPQRAER